MTQSDTHHPPQFTAAGFAEGVRVTLPALPGILAFGVAFGTIAAQKGLSFGEAMAMTTFVYAGMSQLIALQSWPGEFTLTVILSLALVTATVNLRLSLLTASLQPWFAPLPAWKSWPMLFLTTDLGWLLAMRYRDQGGTDYGFYAGSAILVWIAWGAVCIPGYLLGAWVSAPERFGLDVVMPVFFAAMLVPMWKGSRRAIPWLIGGGVALLVDWLVPGWWYLVTGALAGSIAGGFIHDQPE